MTKCRRPDLLIVLLLALPASSSCDEDEGDAADTRPGAAPDSGSPLPDSGSAKCDDVRDRARELLTTAQDCETDSDCILISVDAPCIDTFLCQLPVNAETDVDAFAREAGELAETYRECMHPCTVARCIPPDQLQVLCDAAENRCSSSLLHEVP